MGKAAYSTGVRTNTRTFWTVSILVIILVVIATVLVDWNIYNAATNPNADKEAAEAWLQIYNVIFGAAGMPLTIVGVLIIVWMVVFKPWESLAFRIRFMASEFTHQIATLNNRLAVIIDWGQNQVQQATEGQLLGAVVQGLEASTKK